MASAITTENAGPSKILTPVDLFGNSENQDAKFITKLDQKLDGDLQVLKSFALRCQEQVRDALILFELKVVVSESANSLGCSAFVSKHVPPASQMEEVQHLTDRIDALKMEKSALRAKKLTEEFKGFFEVRLASFRYFNRATEAIRHLSACIDVANGVEWVVGNLLVSLSKSMRFDTVIELTALRGEYETLRDISQRALKQIQVVII